MNHLVSTLSSPQSQTLSSALRPTVQPIPRSPIFRRSALSGDLHALRIPSLCRPLRTVEKPLRGSLPAMAGLSTAKGNAKLLVFGSDDELSERLAEYTSRIAESSVKGRGAFSLVLSGGSLVKALRKLLEPPYANKIEWPRWHVFWVDERVVPKDHPDSNYKLAYDAFLSKVPILPGHVYAINDSLSAEAAADDYETCLRQLVNSKVVDLSAKSGFPKFDLILLGMGPDGHVASLFPGHPLVTEKERWVTFLTDSPKPPPERITFTFPVINSAANIGTVVTGSGKAGAFQRALEDVENPDQLPVQMVSPEGELTWFTDKAASSLLQGSSAL